MNYLPMDIRGRGTPRLEVEISSLATLLAFDIGDDRKWLLVFPSLEDQQDFQEKLVRAIQENVAPDVSVETFVQLYQKLKKIKIIDVGIVEKNGQLLLSSDVLSMTAQQKKSLQTLCAQLGYRYHFV